MLLPYPVSINSHMLGFWKPLLLCHVMLSSALPTTNLTTTPLVTQGFTLCNSPLLDITGHSTLGVHFHSSDYIKATKRDLLFFFFSRWVEFVNGFGERVKHWLH